jgi:2-polyprenyl-3-methyl-5-hydroxy-6-metoxy-1,4-benzoquinol methylase
MNNLKFHSKRTKCRLCDEASLKLVLPLNPVPIGEHYTENMGTNKDVRYPIDLYQCKNCNCVQTADDIDSNFLWDGYTYFSGQTSGIVTHFKKFVESISAKGLITNQTKVFDIGSNDGTLLREFQEKSCEVYGIDPSDIAVKKAGDIGIRTYLGLYSDAVIEKFPKGWNEVDLITAFNVFAHSSDMQGMIKGVRKMLKPEGLFYFEVQYLLDISHKKLLGTIFHEHMIHYSLLAAKNFLENNELKLIGFERNSIQMGSIIFCAAHKNSSHNESPEIAIQIKKELDSKILSDGWSIDFKSYIDEQKNRAVEAITNYKKNGFKLVGYGAARSGPTLAIQYGLENCIEYLLDDHESKLNKYGVFESLQVFPTSVIDDGAKKLVIILAWLHAKNIIKKHTDFLKLGGAFLVLWPYVKIVNEKNYSSWIEEHDKVKND